MVGEPGEEVELQRGEGGDREEANPRRELAEVGGRAAEGVGEQEGEVGEVEALEAAGGGAPERGLPSIGLAVGPGADDVGPVGGIPLEQGGDAGGDLDASPPGVDAAAGGEVSVQIERPFVCPDCGVDLEVTSLDPAEVELAPMEEEDWGE